MESDKVKVVCEGCGGSGTEYDGDGHWDSCVECNGKGYVIAKIDMVDPSDIIETGQQLTPWSFPLK